MTHTMFEWLFMAGTVANMVSIWICIKTYMSQYNRIGRLERVVYELQFFEQLRKQHGTGIPGMAKDTEVRE